MIFPIVQPVRPFHDDDRLLFAKVLSCCSDGTVVERCKHIALHAHKRLVEKLNPVASVSLRSADLGHRLDNPNSEPSIWRVPLATPCSKIECPIVAKVTASVLIPAVPTRHMMQVHQHLQSRLTRKAEDHVDPLGVAARVHDPLQVFPPGHCMWWAVWGLTLRKVDQVPIAQGQTQNVKTELGHPGKVLFLDVGIEETCHAIAGVCYIDVAQT
mmetsp:Transcript_13538/g.38466  ORF Transcript_13538/g.38466 Transcript_13538/m.38466 type:complete len:213 (-) Transcript_13538:451-1089(-)